MTKAFAAWFLVATAFGGTAIPPRRAVEAAVGRIVAVLQQAPDTTRARAEFVEERRVEMRRIATEIFDFDEMSRRALGRHWVGRTPAEQREFIELFTDLLERSYVGRIESYAGERIVYLGEVVDGTFATVRSRIVGVRPADTILDYRLHLDHGRWRVFDLSVDGVSFVGTYRGEFDRIIRRSSYTSLVDRMRKKRLEIDALARRPDHADRR